MSRPDEVAGEGERQRRQVQLAMRRREQLQSESVRRFVHRMETPGMGFAGRTIFDLMADGSELASRVSGDTALPVQPLVQAVGSDDRCECTGLLLTDVWRYFRYTWSSPYESIPGRSLMLLVRDAAHKAKPVLGIAALSSASVKQARRDAYIGWTTERAAEYIVAHPRRQWKTWANGLIDDLFQEIYKDDLLADGILTALTVADVNEDVRAKLVTEATRSREAHQTHPERTASSESPTDGPAWMKRARLELFRSRRCERIAQLSRLHDRLRVLEREEGSLAAALVDNEAGRELLSQLVRLQRARMIGTAIADLTVCGAVAPYNELVGGKLVALLATSPLAVDLYRTRYQQQISVIASSLAGRPVIRSAALVFIGTSSLYGLRPNQYDRARAPVAVYGKSGEGTLGFKYLGRSEGFGVAHIRKETKRRLQAFMEADGRRGWRANNIFGEGANPNLRALREAIGALGLDAHELLRHSQPRAMYGVRLIDNLHEYALGIETRPKWSWGRNGRGEGLASHWWERWAKPRIGRPGVLEAIARHSLARPVCHGARVNLPPDRVRLPSLFEDLE